MTPLALSNNAYRLLRNAQAQGKDDEGCIAFAIAAMGAEHEALIRRVWADNFQTYWGAG